MVQLLSCCCQFHFMKTLVRQGNKKEEDRLGLFHLTTFRATERRDNGMVTDLRRRWETNRWFKIGTALGRKQVVDGEKLNCIRCLGARAEISKSARNSSMDFYDVSTQCKTAKVLGCIPLRNPLKIFLSRFGFFSSYFQCALPAYFSGSVFLSMFLPGMVPVVLKKTILIHHVHIPFSDKLSTPKNSQTIQQKTFVHT